jgi:hypothetical protein
MSLLLLFRPEPVVPHGPENPDVGLDTFLLSASSPFARVDATPPRARVAANDPSSHARANDPTSGVVSV